jgi:hypothetical protein
MDLVLALGLESEYLEGFYVRTEALLKQKRHRKGLRLIESKDDDYRSVLDWLVAHVAPPWDAHIQAFYNERGPRLGEAVDFDTIDLMDRLLEGAVMNLTLSYELLEEKGWLVGRAAPEPGKYMQRVTMNTILSLIAPLFPLPPPSQQAEAA